MKVKLARALIRNACYLALFFLIWSFQTAQAQSVVYTDTVPVQPLRWTDTMSFPQFDPALGILNQVEITLTGMLTGSVSYTNIVNIPTDVSIDVPANLRLQVPNNSLINAGGTIFSFSETVGPLASGARNFTGSVTNSATYQTGLLPYIGVGQITTPVTATSSFVAGGDVGNFDFSVRTTASAIGVVRYVYAIPAVMIKKFTNGFDADNPNDPDVPTLVPGDVVTWTYLITNTGSITVPAASVVVTDSQPGIVPTFVSSSDVNSDSLLSPGETWRYVATGVVQNLATPSAGTTVVAGCNPNNTQVPGQQPTYVNLGQVTVPGNSDTDPSHYCNPPVATIDLQKTVYLGHNQGVSCPGVEAVSGQANAPVTYCFEITNTGETYLDTLVFTDTILGIDLSDLILLSGTTPLAPTGRMVYYYQATIPLGERLNTAQVEANPTDDQGRDLPGLENPRDEDTARVSPVPTAADPQNEPLQKLFIPLIRR